MYTARTRCRSCVCGGNEKQAGPRGGPGKERIMNKKFKLEHLDCANCAAKMERAINELPGVEKATVNFMAQKLVLTAEESRYQEILQKVEEAIRRVEPDCRIVK